MVSSKLLYAKTSKANRICKIWAGQSDVYQIGTDFSPFAWLCCNMVSLRTLLVPDFDLMPLEWLPDMCHKAIYWKTCS